MNFSLRPNTDDDKYIVREIVNNDMYRIGTLGKYLLPTHAFVIDCGAHIGVFSKYVFSFFPNLRFVCFEPNQNNFELLKQNMSDVTSKDLYNKAVSYKSENLRLYMPFDDSKTGQCSFKIYPYLDPNKYIDVPVLDLNVIMKDVSNVFILKMDMEGYESEVLNHLSEENMKKITILIIEEHDDCPINYSRIKDSGFELLFHPCGIDRHSVYVRK